MSKRYLLKKILWWLIACTVCFVAFFAVFPANTREKERIRVLTLWHIDTFEGGKGSRSAFLGKVADSFEKERGEVVVIVSARTAEGVKEGLLNGQTPDMISFGSYFPYLKGTEEPVVWCRGGYAIYSLDENFSSVNSSNTVLSLGGRNQPSVVASLYGIEGEYLKESSTSAYVKFLNGKYEYLLGTQRDAQRFISRGVSVYCQPISEFSDLQQYIVSLSQKNKELSKEFIAYLLEEKRQKLLSSIGMLSPVCEVYTEDDGILWQLQSNRPIYTVSPFMDDAATIAMQMAAEQSNREVLKNFLKRT